MPRIVWPAWARLAVLLAVCSLLPSLYCYNAGRDAERSAQRAARIKRDREIVDSIDAERVLIGAAVAASVTRNDSHVTIVDTAGASRVVEVPREITQRIASDSAALLHKDAMIVDLRLQLRADTAAIKSRDALIASLSIEPPKPPLLDRVLTSVVTSKLGKLAITGGVLYGGIKIARIVAAR